MFAFGRGHLAGISTVSMTILAGFVAAHRHPRLGAERCLFELDGQILAQISAALHSPTTASAASECVSEPEELSEDFAEVLERRAIETRPCSRRTAHPRVSKAVIEGPFLGIGQYRVSLRHFRETLCRIP